MTSLEYIDKFLIKYNRSDDGGVHGQAYVTGYQNQWGADEANLEALLQYGPVATNVKVEHMKNLNHSHKIFIM